MIAPSAPLTLVTFQVTLRLPLNGSASKWPDAELPVASSGAAGRVAPAGARRVNAKSLYKVEPSGLVPSWMPTPWMPPPPSALTGTLTVPFVAVSCWLNARRTTLPVEGSPRPGSDTSSVGVALLDTPVRSYVTGICDPLTTAGTLGASAPRTVASAGPNVRETLLLTVVPLETAWYVSWTVRGVVEATGRPAAVRMREGSRRAQRVVASCVPVPAAVRLNVAPLVRPSQSGAMVIQASWSRSVSDGPCRSMFVGSVSVWNAPSRRARFRRWATATRGAACATVVPPCRISDSTARPRFSCGPTFSVVSACGTCGTGSALAIRKLRTSPGLANGCPVTRAACWTTAAAAATSGAEADVPPLSTTATASNEPPKWWFSATMLSAGAEMLTRLPKPLAKLVKPVQRVSGYACWAAVVPLPANWGGAANTSSSVVPPTSIEPLSATRDGTVDWRTSSRLVGVPMLVGAAPPDGPIAAFVNVRVPSLDEMLTTMPRLWTSEAITDSASGSSSRYRPGKPSVSNPKPRLAVITFGCGLCMPAPRRAPSMSDMPGAEEAGTTSR